jgi:hypothetical protein
MGPDSTAHAGSFDSDAISSSTKIGHLPQLRRHPAAIAGVMRSVEWILIKL